jgi:protein-glutamine gamma-glutamyltransferase
MSFTALYRGSFYLMLVFSTLVLSIDATDSEIAMVYPAVVAIAGALAFLTVDRRPGAGISPAFGTLLALGATALMFVEYRVEPNLLLLALGHWLVYLQIIYMFRTKTVETDWWMFCLGLVQVMVGSVISQTDTVGVMMLCWAILALWVLGLFSLQREAERARSEAGVGVAGASAPHAEPYPGLLNLPFLFSALRVTLTTLALGGVIFLAMPRSPGMARSFRGQGRAQHLTGFDDEVQLGQLGEILENDSVVMSVELFDEHDHRIVPRADWEPLWRGATMASYERGRWRRQDRRTSAYAWFQAGGISTFDPQTAREGVIRQAVRLEGNDSNVLFGLRPILDASARRLSPELNPIDGTIFRNDPRPGTYDYEVRSSSDDAIPQPCEEPPSPYRKHLLLDVPDGLRDRLRSIAEGAVIERLPPQERDDPKKRQNVLDRYFPADAAERTPDATRELARSLEWYLRDSGKFSYTLKLDVVDSSLDPVEDFLVNRKEGHCEYFASALVLMLRSVGIPSRMVNGFKGGDWNSLARILSVRQKHAHSWAEAYLGDRPADEPRRGLGDGDVRAAAARAKDARPIWLTLDATPALERDRSIAQVGGLSGRFRTLTDLVRYIWVFYVVGYDSERQNRLLYGPIRELAKKVREGFDLMAEKARDGRAWLLQWLRFPTRRSLFSVRGFVVSFLALCLAYGVVLLGTRFLRRIWERLVGAGEDAVALLPGAAQYRKLARVLAEYGLERPPAETQDEFARRATVFLTGRGSNTEPVANVPRLVVEAFYRVRFGHRELPDPVVANLDSRLDALEESLRASQG